MSKRYSETGKWADPWFRRLPKDCKLLFLWLVDNCDNAGFWEIDLEEAAQRTGIAKHRILGAWQGLRRAYLEAGRYVWVIRFIKVQNNWPLNPENNAHKQILALFAKHPEFKIDFQDYISSLKEKPLPSPCQAPAKGPCNGKGNGKGNININTTRTRARETFTPPTLQEVQEYIRQNNYDVDAQTFIWHYSKLGWKNTNGKPVKNWKQTLIQVWVKKDARSTTTQGQLGGSSSTGRKSQPARKNRNYDNQQSGIGDSVNVDED